mmetsp:Transcript_56558/g.132672  ORF Transcript_56558/g.132672 Transcript_56558/m.132672 type:complete len:347 (+) Transcript_56558:95-1135(+)
MPPHFGCLLVSFLLLVGVKALRPADVYEVEAHHALDTSKPTRAQLAVRDFYEQQVAIVQDRTPGDFYTPATDGWLHPGLWWWFHPWNFFHDEIRFIASKGNSGELNNFVILIDGIRTILVSFANDAQSAMAKGEGTTWDPALPEDTSRAVEAIVDKYLKVEEVESQVNWEGSSELLQKLHALRAVLGKVYKRFIQGVGRKGGRSSTYWKCFKPNIGEAFASQEVDYRAFMKETTGKEPVYHGERKVPMLFHYTYFQHADIPFTPLQYMEHLFSFFDPTDFNVHVQTLIDSCVTVKSWGRISSDPEFRNEHDLKVQEYMIKLRDATGVIQELFTWDEENFLASVPSE